MMAPAMLRKKENRPRTNSRRVAVRRLPSPPLTNITHGEIKGVGSLCLWKHFPSRDGRFDGLTTGRLVSRLPASHSACFMLFRHAIDLPPSKK
jgi:hypothetical protein